MPSLSVGLPPLWSTSPRSVVFQVSFPGWQSLSPSRKKTQSILDGSDSRSSRTGLRPATNEEGSATLPSSGARGSGFGGALCPHRQPNHPCQTDDHEDGRDHLSLSHLQPEEWKLVVDTDLFDEKAL